MTSRIVDDNGFIEIPNNPISTAGIFEYYGSEIDAPEPDKLYKVFRSPESLENAVSLFNNKPVITGHTMIGNGQTPAEKKGIDGFVNDTFYKDGTVYGTLRLYTERIKKFINDDKRELSFGYWSKYEFKSGTWQGKAYDAIQHIIEGNHLAVLDGEGRMGSTVAVLDHAPKFSQLTFTFDHKALPMDDDKDVVPTEDIDDSIEETPEEQAIEDKTDMMQTATIQSLSDKVDQLAAMVEAMHGKAPEPEATTDEFPPEKDEDEKKVETTDSIAKRVRADIAKASELYKLAQPLVGTFDHSGKSAKEVADYAAGKLGLKGDSETALRAFAHGKQQAKVKATQDATPTAQKLAGNTYE